MATTYALLADLYSRISANTPVSAATAAMCQQLLDAAAESVDAATRGYTPGLEAFSEANSAVWRYDDAPMGVVQIDDFTTITAITRNGASVGDGEYLLGPDYNHPPYYELIFRSNPVVPVPPSIYGWDVWANPGWGRATLAVTGKRGYCAAGNRPAIIKEAVLALAEFGYEYAGADMNTKLIAVRNMARDMAGQAGGMLAHLTRERGSYVV